jgi:hypothetical protein
MELGQLWILELDADTCWHRMDGFDTYQRLLIVIPDCSSSTHAYSSYRIGQPCQSWYFWWHRVHFVIGWGNSHSLITMMNVTHLVGNKATVIGNDPSSSPDSSSDVDLRDLSNIASLDISSAVASMDSGTCNAPLVQRHPTWQGSDDWLFGILAG